MPTPRGSPLKGAGIVGAALLAAAIIEGWHATTGVCIGLDRRTLAAVCTHPPGFWLLDFSALAVSFLIAGGLMGAIAAFVRRVPSRGTAVGTGEGRSSASEGRVRIVVGAVSMGLALVGSLPTPGLERVAMNIWLPNPLWGVFLLLLIGAIPSFAVFTTLLALERWNSRPFYPTVTAIGTFVGTSTAMSFLTAGGAFLILSILAPTLTYLAFAAAHVVDPSFRLSRRLAVGFTLVGLLLSVSIGFSRLAFAGYLTRF